MTTTAAFVPTAEQITAVEDALNWDRNAKEVARTARMNNVPMTSRQAQHILDLLIEQGRAVICQASPTGRLIEEPSYLPFREDRGDVIRRRNGLVWSVVYGTTIAK